MIRRDVLEELRRHLADPQRVCDLLGLKNKAKRQSGGLLVLCPWHQEKTASCSVTRGPDGTLRAKCFSCGAAGDVLSLVAAVHGLDVDRDFKRVVEAASALAGTAYGESPRSHSTAPGEDERSPTPRLSDASFSAIVAPLAYLGRLDASPMAADVVAYLTTRGLLEQARRDGWFALPPPGPSQAAWCRVLRQCFRADDVARAGLLDARGFVWPEHRLCIPWRTPDGTVSTLQRRSIAGGQPKYVFPRGRAPPAPYGIEQLTAAGADVPVALVEGAVDVLAARTIYALAGVKRVPVGVPGLSAWRRDWAKLGSGRVVYVGFDADPAGEVAVVRVAHRLYEAGALDVIRIVPNRGKDWAEELVKS